MAPPAALEWCATTTVRNRPDRGFKALNRNPEILVIISAFLGFRVAREASEFNSKTTV
jgi:hypothetical protein|tara:strand:- start:824 stop:997 length:174 start_codon:yes stop_codon:yes gene_type:complete